MKKKILISIVICIALVIGFILYNNRTVSIITLDINPSVQINLDKKGLVKKVIALNKDAKDVVSNINGKTFDEALNNISQNVIDKGYAEGQQVTILFHVEGKINKESYQEKVIGAFTSKNIQTELIAVDKVTKEDKALAKKYNISKAKAAYINAIKDNNEKVSVDSLIDKQISELKETKNTGMYCDKGYTLEGAFCLKERERVAASFGDVCPNGYYEYNSACYEETSSIITDEYECADGRTLEGTKCIFNEEKEATGNFKCAKGDLIKRGFAQNRKYRDSGDGEEYVCEDKSDAVKPTLRCLTINHKIINGDCYVGPAPLINGGCPNGDLAVGGGCYSKDDGDQWVCPDGGIYEKSKGSYTELCPDTFKYTKAEGTYFCEEGTLSGSKCIIEREEDATQKSICPSGYTKIDNGRCINLSKKKSKEQGYVCNQPDSRLQGKECIIYDIIPAQK